MELLEQLIFQSEFILEEYKQGTFIHGVCRAFIKEISLDLPNRSAWEDPSFKDKKKDIMKKFSIGSRALSDVINVIQTHKEFAQNIGISLKVTEISNEEYVKYKELYNDYHKNLSSQADYIEYKNQIADYIVDTISEDAVYGLRAFWEIGFYKLYSEQYEPLVIHFKSSLDAQYIVFRDLLKSRRILKYIESGMKRCGQLYFIED